MKTIQALAREGTDVNTIQAVIREGADMNALQALTREGPVVRKNDKWVTFRI